MFGGLKNEIRYEMDVDLLCAIAGLSGLVQYTVLRSERWAHPTCSAAVVARVRVERGSRVGGGVDIFPGGTGRATVVDLRDSQGVYTSSAPEWVRVPGTQLVICPGCAEKARRIGWLSGTETKGLKE